MAFRRWAGEVSALQAALAREDEAEAENRRSDNYVRAMQRAYEKGGHLAMERCMYQMVETHVMAMEGRQRVEGARGWR